MGKGSSNLMSRIRNSALAGLAVLSCAAATGCGDRLDASSKINGYNVFIHQYNERNNTSTRSVVMSEDSFESYQSLKGEDSNGDGTFDKINIKDIPADNHIMNYANSDSLKSVWNQAIDSRFKYKK